MIFITQDVRSLYTTAKSDTKVRKIFLIIKSLSKPRTTVAQLFTNESLHRQNEITMQHESHYNS